MIYRVHVFWNNQEKWISIEAPKDHLVFNIRQKKKMKSKWQPLKKLKILKMSLFVCCQNVNCIACLCMVLCKIKMILHLSSFVDNKIFIVHVQWDGVSFQLKASIVSVPKSFSYVFFSSMKIDHCGWVACIHDE